jgi:ribosome-binding protein aMBF1 (putative translation factor)
MSKTRKSTERKSPSRKGRMTSDALEIIDRQVIGDDPALRKEIKQAEFDLEVAQLIYDARTAAGLTQAALAKLVGTNQSVISRLEDADYEGHSLSMLRRIADALDRRLEISFGPKGKPGRQTA